MADIKGSIAAITEGRYKDANMVGAACITAILNANRTHEMPMYLVAAESSEHVKLALF
ncbi:MAG: DUF3095 family protein, partial [Rhodospirillales bacterium]